MVSTMQGHPQPALGLNELGPAHGRTDMPRLKHECPQSSFSTRDSLASHVSQPRIDTSFADGRSATLPNRFASWNRSYMQDNSDESTDSMVRILPDTFWSAPSELGYVQKYEYQLADVIQSHAPDFSSTASQASSYAAPTLPTQTYASKASVAPSPRSHRYNEDSREPMRTVSPTWHGWVECTEDALKIIEACIIRKLTPVHRRPDEHERPRIIKSGAVFVYDETTTGISRWTDDRNWSPSRVRGSFMLYRELDDKVLPGEKKKALKRSRQASNDVGSSNRGNSEKSRREDESSVLGSHHDSYPYKKECGLMKRTFSAYHGENKWSVISYYDPDHVTQGMLPRVCDDENLRDIEPRLAPKYSQSPISPQTSNESRASASMMGTRRPSASSYEPSYDQKHQATTSYPTPPTIDGIPEPGSYAQEMPMTAALRSPPYDSPSYSPTVSYGPGFQGYSHGYTPSAQQYHYSYPSYAAPVQSSMPSPIYNMPQQSPMIDPRSFSAHGSAHGSATPSRRGSVVPQQQSMMQHAHANGAYHESQTPYYTGPHGAPKFEHQPQPLYGAWSPHDERVFPPPKYARPN